MDDSTLISRRQEIRAQLERLPPHSAGHSDLQAIYDQSTEVVSERARAAWMAGLAMAENNTARVRLLAVEMLLAYPDTLNNALETDLWLLRDQLTAVMRLGRGAGIGGTGSPGWLPSRRGTLP